MKNISHIRFHTITTWVLLMSILVLVCAFTPFVAFGADAKFVSLAGLPGVTPQASGGLANYLNQLYILLIVIGAIIAAIKISVAGAKYALSDVITDKGEAKKDIFGVLLGLAILLLPYLVLSTINSTLTDLNILGNAGDLKTTINPTPADPTATATQGPKPAASYEKGTIFEVLKAEDYTPECKEVWCQLTPFEPIFNYSKAKEACNEKGGELFEKGPEATCVYSAVINNIDTKTGAMTCSKGEALKKNSAGYYNCEKY